MVDLIASSPARGLLPRDFAGVRIEEVALGRLTAVLPFRGQERACSAALHAAVGLRFPKPNRVTSKDGCRAIWIGPGQALIAAEPLPEMPAALVDQSDGWCGLSLSGTAAEAVLARLVPVDLRAPRFARGHTARTLLGHVTVSVTRSGAARFEVLGPRSMAGTMVEDLSRAATLLAARSRFTR